MALTLAAFLPYIRSILRRRIQPHIFSWLVWGINTSLAFFAALATGGGNGAWAIGFSAAVSLCIASLVYLKGSDLTITRVDWIFLIAAIVPMPIWYLMRDPQWAVCLITLIELFGFGPTLRKTWHQPHSESMTFMGMMAVRNVMVINALDNYAATTVLFPASMALACLVLIALMAWRRCIVAR